MSIALISARRRSALALVLASAVVAPVLAKPAKKKPPAPPSTPDLPADLNVASLRVGAMQTLYELDASPEQLHLIRTAAQGTGVTDGADRPPPKGSDKLAKALKDLRDSLVEPTPDDDKVAAARNALADATGEADVQLDDAVHPTPAARVKAAAVCRAFSAGQVAAYLAAHADQVAGPTERLMAGLAEVRDGDPGGADAEVRAVAAEVGHLVAGGDAARCAAVTAKAADWLKANRTAEGYDTAEGHARLESSARAAVVGDVSPVEVLGHWFEDEVAMLLSNPQLPEASEALLTAREKEPH